MTALARVRQFWLTPRFNRLEFYLIPPTFTVGLAYLVYLAYSASQ
jgi:hypothetical protein